MVFSLFRPKAAEPDVAVQPARAVPVPGTVRPGPQFPPRLAPKAPKPQLVAQKSGEFTYASPVHTSPPAESFKAAELIVQRDQLGVLLNHRGEVKNLVGKAFAQQCLVLDMGYNSAAIVCVPEFQKNQQAQYQSIKELLSSSKSMSVSYEAVVIPEVMALLVDEVQKIGLRVAQVVDAATTEDMRNLKLFNDLVAGAYKIGSNDIHFIVMGDHSPHSFVRLRIFGRISPWKQFPTKHLKAALAAGYSSCSVPGTNSDPDWTTNKPCSTITKHVITDDLNRRRSVSGRFTSRPSVDDSCVAVMRLLDTDVRNVHIPSLEELGYAKSHINEQLMPALRKNEGCILIAGGTGSGKSTTLRTFMHNLPDKHRLARYSVEDPVEYVLPGVVQLSIQRTSDATESATRLQFTSALRDLMRMDPDVAMIGEIRDEETARLVTEMVSTGHRVLTTVHGNGNIDVLDRMTGKTLAVPAATLSGASYLLVVMYQKLLPVLCPDCRRPARGFLTPSQLEGVRRFGLDIGSMYVANPQGCETCRIEGIEPTGTKGQTVAAEVFTPRREMLDLVRDQNWPALRDLWRGMRKTDFGDADMTGKTAFEHAIYKVSRGLIDINDVERDFQPLETYDIHPMAAKGAP